MRQELTVAAAALSYRVERASTAPSHPTSTRGRYCSASATCGAAITSAPTRSAIVRAGLSVRSRACNEEYLGPDHTQGHQYGFAGDPMREGSASTGTFHRVFDLVRTIAASHVARAPRYRLAWRGVTGAADPGIPGIPGIFASTSKARGYSDFWALGIRPQRGASTCMPYGAVGSWTFRQQTGLTSLRTGTACQC